MDRRQKGDDRWHRMADLWSFEPLLSTPPRGQPDPVRARTRSASPQNFQKFPILSLLTVFFLNFHIFQKFPRPRNAALVQFLRGYIKVCRPLVKNVKSLILSRSGSAYKMGFVSLKPEPL